MPKKKRYFIPLAVLTAILLAGYAYRVRQHEAYSVQPMVAPMGLEDSQLLVTAPKSSVKLEDFPADAQAKVEKCLGSKAGNFAELESLVGKIAGSPNKDKLNWQVVQFDDASGRNFRLRQEKDPESARMKLTLFAVDEEGMPDRVSLGPEETLETILREKRITKEIESREFGYANHFTLTVEKEDGVTQKLAVIGNDLRLACENTQSGPDCHCVH